MFVLVAVVAGPADSARSVANPVFARIGLAETVAVAAVVGFGPGSDPVSRTFPGRTCSLAAVAV